MRHSKIDLTMRTYTDPRLLDMGEALDALPALRTDPGEPTEQRAIATVGGPTHDAAKPTHPAKPVDPPSESLGHSLGLLLGQAASGEGRGLTADDVERDEISEAATPHKSNAKRGIDASSRESSVSDEQSGRRDSNAQHPAWKAGALPLSYTRRFDHSKQVNHVREGPAASALEL